MPGAFLEYLRYARQYLYHVTSSVIYMIGRKCGLWSHNPHIVIPRAQTSDITHARDSEHE